MDLVPTLVTECVPRKGTHRRIGQSGHHIKTPAWTICGNTFSQILNYFSKRHWRIHRPCIVQLPQTHGLINFTQIFYTLLNAEILFLRNGIRNQNSDPHHQNR